MILLLVSRESGPYHRFEEVFLLGYSAPLELELCRKGAVYDVEESAENQYKRHSPINRSTHPGLEFENVNMSVFPAETFLEQCMRGGNCIWGDIISIQYKFARPEEGVSLKPS
jgi:hypothetical protein